VLKEADTLTDAGAARKPRRHDPLLAVMGVRIATCRWSPIIVGTRLLESNLAHRRMLARSRCPRGNTTRRALGSAGVLAEAGAAGDFLDRAFFKAPAAQCGKPRPSTGASGHAIAIVEAPGHHADLSLTDDLNRPGRAPGAGVQQASGSARYWLVVAGFAVAPPMFRARNASSRVWNLLRLAST